MSKDFKGTKGKWKVKPSESKTAVNVVGTELGLKYKIARYPYMLTGNSKIDKQEIIECEANAKLIASAPDLLKALQSALPYLQQHALELVIKKAEKAISKALD